MSETFLSLPRADRLEALEVASTRSGRPAYLLEKDVWVVWALSVLFTSQDGRHLSFKGGTSLSKVYGIINRFSEDIDLTYDVRAFLPDLAGGTDGLPSRSRGSKWTEKIRQKLPEWIGSAVKPLFEEALRREGIQAELRQETKERLYIDYDPLLDGDGYVKPSVMLEFGARSTGEPVEEHDVGCDAAPHLAHVRFPSTRVRAMKVARTFWEKATAAHVYCVQKNLKGDRFARHWHDLAAIARTGHFEVAVKDQALASQVARHKLIFFREKDASGQNIDYTHAVSGNLILVPTGEARHVLQDDYDRMVSSGLLDRAAPTFDDLMSECAVIQEKANAHHAQAQDA